MNKPAERETNKHHQTEATMAKNNFIGASMYVSFGKGSSLLWTHMLRLL